MIKSMASRNAEVNKGNMLIVVTLLQDLNCCGCFLDSIACIDVACDETQQYRARDMQEKLVGLGALSNDY